MNKFVKSSGGNLVRIGQAIDGFKSKYGYWPIALHLDTDTLEMLKTHHLTDEGFIRLNSFVSVVGVHEMCILATGTEGHTFDYSSEGWCGEPLRIGSIQVMGFND